jgi:hypothetical protein
LTRAATQLREFDISVVLVERRVNIHVDSDDDGLYAAGGISAIARESV